MWVRDDAIVVKDADGKPDYVQGFLIDVTAQHESHLEALEASARQQDAELRYRRLVEELPLVVYLDLPDASSTSVYISPSVETMTGHPPEAWMDPAFFASVLHPDDRERVIAQSHDELHDGHDPGRANTASSPRTGARSGSATTPGCSRTPKAGPSSCRA